MGSGARGNIQQLRQLVEQPSREYPRFGAALMFLGALRRKEEAIKALERRAETFEEEIENVDSMLRGLPPFLPRLFAIEDEYTQAMRRAELEWLRRTIAELNEGTLEWPLTDRPDGAAYELMSDEIAGPRSVNSKGPQINPGTGVNRHPRRPTEG